MTGQIPSIGLQMSVDPISRSGWSDFADSIIEVASNLAFKGWADGGVSAVVAATKALTSIKTDTPASYRAYALNVLSFAWACDQLRTWDGVDVAKLRMALKSALVEAKNEINDGLHILTYNDLSVPSRSSLFVALQSHVIKKREEIFPNVSLSDLEIAAKLAVSFDRGTYEIWSRNPLHYEVIQAAMNVPANKKVEQDLNWERYRKQLIHSFEVKPVFGLEDAAVALQQLYVPLRATWLEQGEIGHVSGTINSHKETVLMLDEELLAWATADGSDRVRLIGGGPGSGKSTSLRALASALAKREDLQVLFIPLQYMDLTGDLRGAIGRYFTDRSHGAFKESPLTREAVETGKPIVLLFDGLDELVAPIQGSSEVISDLVRRVQGLLASLKGDGNFFVKVALSGRMPAFQTAKRYLEISERACLEVIGFAARENEDDELFQIDQRERWWRQYATATGKATNLPPALSAHELKEITNEPLLCYLLVLAGFAADDWKDAADNKNHIYRRLMDDIFARGWGEGEVKRLGPGRTLQKTEFLSLMQTVGLAAWLGGDARIASVDSFHSTLKVTGAGLAWGAFVRDNGTDVTNLAMNFYLKAADLAHRGFEFTHKSFGEYLCAVALVEIALRDFDLVSRKIDFAMDSWWEATATGVMTPEIAKFISDELRIRATDGHVSATTLQNLAKSFEVIADVAATSGFRVKASGSFSDQSHQQANAECATWSILNGAAVAFRSLKKNGLTINVPSLEQWGLRDLIYRHQAQTGYFDVISTLLSDLRLNEILLVGIASDFINLSYCKITNIIAYGVRSELILLHNAEVESLHLDACSVDDLDLSVASIGEVHLISSSIGTFYDGSARINNFICDVGTIFLSNFEIGDLDKLGAKYSPKGLKKEDVETRFSVAKALQQRPVSM